MKKLTLAIIVLLLIVTTFTGCNPSVTVTHNLKTDAESYRLYRKITAINNQTDNVLFEIEGYLNYENETDGDLSITIETGKNQYYRHVVHINDRTTFVVEQLDASQFSPYSYKIRIFAAYPNFQLGQ